MDIVLMIFALLALVALLVAGALFRERFGWLIQGGLAIAFVGLGVAEQGWQRWTWFALAAVNVALGADALRKRRKARAQAPAAAPKAEGPGGAIG